MLKGLPYYIPVLFILTTLVTLFFFIAATRKNNSRRVTVIVLIIIIDWLLLHAILALENFYTVTDTFPPRFVLMVAPVFLVIIFLFLTSSGRRFIDSLSPKILTQLHMVRIFVEIILFWLFIYKYIPKLMTFEGRNVDILAGLTAPFVAWYGFVKGKLSNRFMLIWNIVCLLLLLNIVVNAILSAPSRFQQIAFDQPNVAGFENLMKALAGS